MRKPSFFTGLLLGVLISATALCATDVTGKWSGTLQMEGENDSKSAYVILKQDGNRLTGSAGPNESEQHSFEGGKIDGNRLTFDVSLGGEGSMHFDLQVQGDQITGQVKRSGEGRNEAAKISLKRVAESKNSPSLQGKKCDWPFGYSKRAGWADTASGS
ncbi:MAG: hypothetical protein DMG40_12460 [Acidobacteria bacterium]|nr:MAG: hypothetical protein DMG40_12460 [Acidobacteriota bacterium]